MDVRLLAGLLTLGALVAATDMYLMLVRRRARGRRADQAAQGEQEAGRRGLVRVGLLKPAEPRAIGARQSPRWIERWRRMRPADEDAAAEPPDAPPPEDPR